MSHRFLDAIKLTIPVVFVISVTYEFFYFLGMGWRLSQAPLHTQDFINGWMVWGAVLLPFLSGVLTTSFSGLVKFDFFRGLSEHPTETEKLLWEQKQSLVRIASWGCFSIGLLLLMKFILEGEFHFYVLQTSLLFFGLSFLIRSAFLGSIPNFYTFLKFFSIGLLSYCSLAGFENGTSVLDDELRLPNPVTRQTTKVLGVDEAVIRVFDQWTLIRQSPRHYAWINHQSGETIEFQAWRKRYQGIRCVFNENACYYDKRESDSFK
jgi:hypothetical protein